MLTKEQRDEIRRRANAATSPPWASEGESRWENVTATVDGVEDTRIAEVARTPDREFIANARADVPALLDALDEMEEKRDHARGTAQALARECTSVADELGIRDDDSAVLAIQRLQSDLEETKLERDELRDVLRSLAIRHRNEDGTKRTADEIWAEVKTRA